MMPLTSSTNPNVDNSNLFFIRFPMMDGDKIVAVRVSDIALQDRAARDGRQTEDIIVLFQDYRDEVENAASRKYDEGHQDGSDVMVIAADLS
jgi:hypothetical protein